MGCEFLRMKGILDEIGETEDETKMISEVSWIKANLDSSGDKSEWVLGYLLKKLKQMVVSMKVLEATMIGKSVSSLQKHASKRIRQTARMLIRSWRRMVDEWMIANDNMLSVSHEEERGGSNKNLRIEKQVVQTQGRPPVAPTPRNGKGDGQSKEMVHKHEVMTKKKLIDQPKLQRKKRLTMVVLEKDCFPREVKEKRLSVVERHMPSALVETTMKSQNSSVAMALDKKTIEEKREAAERKLRECYKEAENSKRQRRTQVIEVHDVLRLGLDTKHKDKDSSRLRNHMMRPNCVGLVR